MTGWDLLPRIVLLLAAAAMAGLLLRAIGQSVIVGYLLAGVLLGPTVLGVVRAEEDVQLLSELGIALLLFSIGLEFSLSRLRQFGRSAVGTGTAQMVLTAVVVSLVAHALGVPWNASAILGMAFAMSSTAVVLRGLTDRAELDSNHGRNALGVLLFQDLAVIPVLIAVDALSQRGGAFGWVPQFSIRAGYVILFMFGAWLVARLILPRILTAAALSGSRELPVVIAVCSSIGAAWGAHSLEFSPSLGAFLAGMVLSESPFATQIRADLTPLSAVFTTLFFASVGTLVQLPADPRYLGMLVLAAAAVMLAKTMLTAVPVLISQHSLRTALVTGACISQVGEFTFVVAQSAYGVGLLSASAFQFTLGISLLTLIATPYAMKSAPGWVAMLMRSVPVQRRSALDTQRDSKMWRRVIVIGFGPAGQQVVARLQERKIPFLVLDMNPNTVAAYRSSFSIELGDASQREVLLHIGVGQSLAVVITTPDPATAQLICQAVQRLAAGVPVIARSRYHQYRAAIEKSGADRVIDEEQVVGLHLANEALEAHTRQPAPEID